MSHPKKERTLIIIKPDAVQRTLVGEIVKRYERAGLKLVAVKMVIPTEDHVEKHYTLDPDWRRVTGEKTIKSYLAKGDTPPSEDPLRITEMLLLKLRKYMVSGPVIPMVWEGIHAVEAVRKITGSTEPRTSDVGTIRGDFIFDSYAVSDGDGRSLTNLVHASGSVKEAEMEISHWFKPEEIIDYTLLHESIIENISVKGIF